MLLFFFFFFHTLVKHGHRAPDYRLQNHIHTVLSKETHRHGCSQGSRGGVSRLCLQEPPLSCPRLIKFCFCFFFLLFFGKSKFVKPQNQMRIPLKNELFSNGTHARTSTTWPSGTDLQMGLPLTSKPPPQKNKPNLGRDILGFLLPGAEHEYILWHVCSRVCGCAEAISLRVECVNAYRARKGGCPHN